MSYVSQKQGANPAGLAAAVLINGGVVAAAFLMSVAVVPRITEPRIKTFDVPADQPPPVPLKQAEQEVKLKKPDPVYADKPIVDIPVKPLDSVSTTDIIADPPFYTDTAGPKIALNTGVKDAIAKVVPPPVFKAATRDPRFARDFQPAYPVGLLQREIEGKATIKVLVGTDGRVRQAIVIAAAHPDFGKAAERQALTRWRFTPATRDGKPVEDWQTLTVRFDINE
jgi:periplasmic protein TonB